MGMVKGQSIRMPEIELESEDVAKTLQEHLNDALAAARIQYNQMVAMPFMRTLLEYSTHQALKAGQNVINTLEPREKATYEKWTMLSNGTFMLDALNWQYGNLRAEFDSIEGQRQLEAKAAARKAGGDGDADGAPPL